MTTKRKSMTGGEVAEATFTFVAATALILLGCALLWAYFWVLKAVVVFCVHHWWQLLIVVATLTLLDLLGHVVNAHCRREK